MSNRTCLAGAASTGHVVRIIGERFNDIADPSKNRGFTERDGKKKTRPPHPGRKIDALIEDIKDRPEAIRDLKGSLREAWESVTAQKREDPEARAIKNTWEEMLTAYRDVSNGTPVPPKWQRPDGTPVWRMVQETPCPTT